MTDLFSEQLRIEEECRNAALRRFLSEVTEGAFTDTLPGVFLLKSFLNPFASAIRDWLSEATSGRPGPRNKASTLLEQIRPEVSAFITLKSLLSALTVQDPSKHLLLSSVAIGLGRAIGNEIRINRFEAEHAGWFKNLTRDFERRELTPDKRLEYFRKILRQAGEPWNVATTADYLHAGLKLLDIFTDLSGDVEVVNLRQRRKTLKVLQAKPALLDAVQALIEKTSTLMTDFAPMVVPPVPWSPDTLRRGGYISHHTPPYRLVKRGKKDYMKMLTDKARNGELDDVLDAINAIQETPWRINSTVLDALRYVYSRNIECGKLPRADNIRIDPPPADLNLDDRDNEAVRDYLTYRARTHEANRRMVGKRMMALRAIGLAERFERYEAIYFPHDLDSRGRAYPKPTFLNPQGPDFVKGLLEFADGKPLGERGRYWLEVHGANCWGEDKLPLDERAAWVAANAEMICSVGRNPKDDLRWTQADAPVQFLAFAVEYAEFCLDVSGSGCDFISHLHVDVDATCSGLQHFSGMLQDEVGGFHVNMVPGHARQDVYGAVAAEATRLLTARAAAGEDDQQMAQAWLDAGLMDRKLTKRPVMVKPYAGTRNSCNQYVNEAVTEKLQRGHALPWPAADMFNFKLYGAGQVWQAIPSVVVAADSAMRWISRLANLVGKSQPSARRIEWTTPAGLPVHQYKFDLAQRRIDTVFKGSTYRAAYFEETDRLDPRKMASSVAPSFVHSMDACHLQLTTAAAVRSGLRHFAMVHDSFGVHAADTDAFARIIREQFVRMYLEHDVLDGLLQSALPLISETLRDDIPPAPPKGRLDLSGIFHSEFFFS